MTTTRDVGRNGPCPCGSGKKYKHCCLHETAGQPPLPDNLLAWHQMDNRLVQDMVTFARRRFGKVWLRGAFDAFYPEGIESDESDLQLLVPWSVFHFPAQEQTVYQWFLAEPGVKLSAEERAWLTSQQASRVTLWEVTEVQPGYGVSVRDLLGAEAHFVREIKASQSLVLRDTILGRVVEHGGVALFCGIHPRLLPPEEAARVLEVVQGSHPARPQGAGTNLPLIHAWQRAVVEMDQRPLPHLSNTDGDPFLFTTDRFRFDPTERQELLRRLAAMRQVEAPEEGAPQTIITFLRSGNKLHSSWQNTIVGSATIKDDHLVLETNSTRRAGALRRRVERACGELLTFVSREQKTVDALRQQMGERDRSPAPPKPKEAAELVRALKARHYETWVDERIPALGGLTPREAVLRPEGRKQVDLLLRGMENRESRLPPDERFDVSILRARLGLEE